MRCWAGNSRKALHLQLVLLHLAFSTAKYPDEPLNPRISNPMLQGRCLVANIDHVPCTIQLPDSVIGAHQSGALPLNTLANAILAKNDQMRQMAAMQYEEQARESVVRPRGIQ